MSAGFSQIMLKIISCEIKLKHFSNFTFLSFPPLLIPVIVLANTLRFQHLLVDKISKIVTKQTGFKVEFEHADVASWGDSAICLKVHFYEKKKLKKTRKEKKERLEK